MARANVASSSGSGKDYAPPSEAQTLDGTTYDPREDHWAIRTLTRTYHFDFSDLLGRGMARTLINSFKGCAIIRLRSHTGHSAFAFYYGLLRLLRHIADHYPGVNAISSPHLASYSASLSRRWLHRSTFANREIEFWVALGLPGVTEDAFKYAVEAEKFYNVVGRAVRARCPIHGPYTSLEYDGLYKALHAAFACGGVELYNYVLCLLSGALGPRPGQLALLKVCDLAISCRDDGSKKYVLSMPRIKQRHQKWRSEFKDRELVGEIGMVLEVHAEQVRAEAARAGLDPALAPLFPKALYYERVTEPMQHNTPSAISTCISETLEKLDVKSERTGERINATPSRQRRTLGTRAGQEGASPAVIADLLDHSNTANVMIYVEASLQLLRRVDEKMALHLAPLAQRFRGRIADRDENGMTRHVFGIVQCGDTPEDIGGCGKHSICRLPKPLACYTCVHFQPWQDGPHESVLECLLARREKQAETGSLRVAESLDDTILAVAWVVQRCRIQKAVTQEASDD